MTEQETERPRGKRERETEWENGGLWGGVMERVVIGEGRSPWKRPRLFFRTSLHFTFPSPSVGPWSLLMGITYPSRQRKGWWITIRQRQGELRKEQQWPSKTSASFGCMHHNLVRPTLCRGSRSQSIVRNWFHVRVQEQQLTLQRHKWYRSWPNRLLHHCPVKWRTDSRK